MRNATMMAQMPPTSANPLKTNGKIKAFTSGFASRGALLSGNKTFTSDHFLGARHPARSHTFFRD